MAGNANKGFAASEIQKSIEDHLGIPALLDLPNKKCCDSKKEYKKLSDKHISILEKSRAIRPTTPWLADILIMISDDICVKRQSFEPPTITTAAQPKKGKRKWRTLMRKRTNRPTTQKISRKKRFIKGLKGFGNGVAYVAAGILDMMCHPCFWH
ncbi:hypothetical protein HOD08_05285 [bacterium]|nr:hypothetical protein [bacterium]